MVEVEGVVVVAQPRRGVFWVHDGDRGIAVYVGNDPAWNPGPSVGTRVRITSPLQVTGWVPSLGGPGATSQWVVLGSAPLPTPQPLAPAEIDGGRYGGHRVRVRGLIRAITETPGGAELQLGTGIGRITVLAPPTDPGVVPPPLVGSRVELDAMMGLILNQRGQWVGNLLFLGPWEDIRILQPPVDFLEAPLVSVRDLPRYGTAGADSMPVRVRGVVLAAEGQWRAALRCDDGAVWAYMGRAIGHTPAPGLQVEAMGHPILVGTRWVLHDVVFRILGAASLPPPVVVPSGSWIPETLDAELVQVEGRWVQVSLRGSQVVGSLDTGAQLIEVAANPTMSSLLRAIRADSRVRITGIASVQSRMSVDGRTVPTGWVQVAPRTPADIVILAGPPWWTPQRLFVLIGLLAAGALWLAGWTAWLRHQVQQQEKIIRATAQREAVTAERARIARDLHDEVGAWMTQIALMTQSDPPAGGLSGESLGRVSAAVQEAIRALDEIVWTVNPRNDRLDNTVSYCCRLIRELLHDTPVRPWFDVAEDLPDAEMSATVRHHLLMAIKEVVRNVIRHANATELRTAIRWAHGRLQVELADNGRGFDPVSVSGERNGLINVRARMEAVGGSMRLCSAPGQGTRVVLDVGIGPTTN